MKVLIYGAGSVGLGLASCLIKSGEEVALIGREETVQALRQEGLWRTGIFGNYKAAAEDFICFTYLQDLPNEDYDYVLVCTKTFDTEIAAKGHIILSIFAERAWPGRSMPERLGQRGDFFDLLSPRPGKKRPGNYRFYPAAEKPGGYHRSR